MFRKCVMTEGKPLNDNGALITGGACRLGRASAFAWGKAGARIVVNG